ncbi:uncharacterized protein LOC121367285 [Gigantopelta aegis]|uniref:uncharacterized protein LOC121367285 n=1 Tax=Gigantopelta aegis TaxID=1735272 RepID=UPI001B88D955|nr:uncharacterized protein LOC121367285 [Gigantopelta aegis]
MTHSGLVRSRPEYSCYPLTRVSHDTGSRPEYSCYPLTRVSHDTGSRLEYSCYPLTRFSHDTKGLVRIFQVMCGDCPSDAEQRMSQCTSPIAHVLNVTHGSSPLRSVGEKCRILKQIPMCLDQILYECKGHTDIAPIMSILKEQTYRWKHKFDKLCSIATESSAGHNQMLQATVAVFTILTCILRPCLL